MPPFPFHFQLALPPFLFASSNTQLHRMLRVEMQLACGSIYIVSWNIFTSGFACSLFRVSPATLLIPIFFSLFCIPLFSSIVLIVIIWDSGSVLFAGEQLDSTGFKAAASAACMGMQRMPLGRPHAAKTCFQKVCFADLGLEVPCTKFNMVSNTKAVYQCIAKEKLVQPPQLHGKLCFLPLFASRSAHVHFPQQYNQNRIVVQLFRL